MKSLFEENIEQKLFEAAQICLSNRLRDAADSDDDLSIRILADARREASLSGKELLNEYRKHSEKKFKHKDKVNRILDFMKNNCISTKDKRIFDKILGDHKILSKLIFVTDGSYRSNRIFYKKFNFEDSERTSFGIENIYYPYKKNQRGTKIYDVDVKNLLNHMKGNYENIFIDLVSDTCAAESKIFSDMMDDYDYDYYEDEFA